MREILIIEDSPEFAEFIQLALSGMPMCEFHVAGSGRRARTLLLQAERFAALISDVGLPDADGIELVRELRRHAEFDKLPILVMSAGAEADLPQRALAAGATGFLRKSCTPAELRHQMEVLLGASLAT
jgi:two-component system, OmpR family, catabolic regulation response regulator CreB